MKTPPMLRSSHELSDLLDAFTGLAKEYLEAESSLPGPALRDPLTALEHLPLRLGEEGHELAEVIQGLRRVLQATPSSSSWRFVNQLFGGRVAVGTLAEMLTALPSVSMYTFKAGGAQVLVEREVLRRMLEKVGFSQGEGCFTPGGSLANLVAMLLARNAADPHFREEGGGHARLTVYTSVEGHYSIAKAAGILGLGRRQVRPVPVAGDGRMDPEALATLVRQDRAQGFQPTLVNATAGTTVRGAFDPFREIQAIAREHGMWMHVDGALGGSIALSRAHRGLLEGIEGADSYAWNPHKMMGLPLQTSVLLVAQQGSLARSLDETADYLYQADADAFNPGHRSILCGRRSDAFKLWAAWYLLGDEGWDQRIERQMALARTAATMIDADPELRLVEWPMSINVCFQVPGKASADICERLDQEGRLKIGHGEIAGNRAIRLVCVNPDLEEDDLAALLSEVKAAASSLPAGG